MIEASKFNWFYNDVCIFLIFRFQPRNNDSSYRYQQHPQQAGWAGAPGRHRRQQQGLKGWTADTRSDHRVGGRVRKTLRVRPRPTSLIEEVGCSLYLVSFVKHTNSLLSSLPAMWEFLSSAEMTAISFHTYMTFPFFLDTDFCPEMSLVRVKLHQQIKVLHICG